MIYIYGVGLFFDLFGPNPRKDNVVRSNTGGLSWGWRFSDPDSLVFYGAVLFTCSCLVLVVLAFKEPITPTQVPVADPKPVPAEAAPHVCDGCVGAMKAVEYLTSQLRSRYDLVPSEQALTPPEYEQARAYLASTKVDDLPPGWESAIVVKKRSEGGGNDLAIAIADGSFRVLQAGASSEGPVPGNQLRHELDSHQMAAILDLGDHLILNPAAFGRSRESPQWVFKTGEWRIIKKFAIPTAPPK